MRTIGFWRYFAMALGVLFLCAGMSLAAVLPVSAERRIALVVGNSAYRNVPPLTNPANDAKLIADTLQSLGFELVGGSAQLDLDKPGFEAIVKRFGTLMQGADVGLFYYAGHGVQVRGANYLVPVSANPEREADVDFEMLDAALVMRQMEGARTRLNLIILDACRNNPFGGRALRGSDRGLAQMIAPEGTLISFATQPGNVASDGEDGDSPYTKALAQTVKKPGLGIFDVFNEVGLAVKKQTGGAQQPWVSSSPIGGSFYFSGPSVAQPAPLAMAPAPAEQPDKAQQVWNTIQNTTSIAVIERFIEQFPTSSYGDIARARLDELKKKQVSSPTAPATVSSSEQRSEPGNLNGMNSTGYQKSLAKVTRYSNMDARGNDAEWVHGIESVEQCESLCLADAVCAGFTYNVKYRTCIPKTAIGALSPSTDPAITGVVERRTGGAGAAAAGGSDGTKITRFRNMDARGNDAKWVHAIASVEECENLCLTDPSCAGYTYNVNKATCIPKTAIGSLTPTREPAITGVVNQRSGGSIAQSGMPPAATPSFDCLKARATGERAICASQILSRLDGELANRYRAWLDSHSGAAASVSQRHQKDFLAGRKKCRANTSCLEEIYRQRIGDFPGQPQSWELEQGRSAAYQSDLSATQNRVITIAGKPSFDCHKAKSETSQTICGSPQLINLDLQLAKLFWDKMAKLKGARADEEKHRQYDWGAARNQCGADAACIEQSYLRRIAEFEGHTYLPPIQQAPEQKPQHAAEQKPPPAAEQKPQDEAPARSKGPIAAVQQLPNPIRLIGQADQPCDVASAILARLRKALSVSVPEGLTVQAESLRAFTWKTSGAPPLGPAYLVLATDAPARFRGTGFYALTPEAKAPFRIKQFLKDTRVIIPLHVKGTPQNGEIKIRPLIAGPLKVSAAIIGYTQCGENPDPAPIAFDMTVEPGAPEIVIADRFDLAKPDQIIASPDGTRRIEIYGPRYHLIDAATGALLADDIGTEPRFSPTGRFIIARKENAYSTRDALDGKVIVNNVGMVRHVENANISWDDQDSFAIYASSFNTDMVVVQSVLNEAGFVFNRECLKGGYILNVLGFRIDLENNASIKLCEERGSLAEASTLSMGADPDLLGSLLVLPFTSPRNWEMIEGLKFTRISDHVEQYDKAIAAELTSFVIRPILLKGSEAGTPLADKDPLRVASRGIGQVNLPEADLMLQRENRLRDFGFEINHGVPLNTLDRSRVFKRIDGPIELPWSWKREAMALRGGDSGFVRQLTDDTAIRFNMLNHKGYFEREQCGELTPRTSGGIDVFIPREGTLDLKQVQGEGFRLTVIGGSCLMGFEQPLIVGFEEPLIFPYGFLYDSRVPGQLLNLRKELYQGTGLSNTTGEFFGIGFEGELFFNRYLVVWSQKSIDAAVYDINKRELIYHIINFPSPDVMQRISLSHDLKTLVKLDKDGGFQVIGLRPGQKYANSDEVDASQQVLVLLSGRVVDDEVVVWTPSGQFDSTLEGASHVALRFPGRGGEYTLDQFHKLFHENDLLKRALAGEQFKPPVVKTFPPSITAKPSFTADSIAAKIEVLGDDPVEEIRIYQDGLMTGVVPVAVDAKSTDVSAKRLPGARWIAFLARGPSGLYSQASTFDAGLFPGARRRVHIVSVGIDHYDDDRIQQLHFAGSDASRFLKTLQEKGGTAVEIVSQTLLRDAEASREAIFAKLNETIAKAEPGDSILLFIAGHGVQDTATKTYYLATSATRVDNIEHTSLRWSELSSALAKAHSRIAVFLDTCNSGAAGTDFFATNDALVSALIDRAPSGILIFSASKGREFSEESADHGGGVFTSAVIAALSDPKTDRNHNGVIEASELYAGVKRTVVEVTEGRQTPWFARNDMVGDFVPF